MIDATAVSPVRLNRPEHVRKAFSTTALSVNLAESRVIGWSDDMVGYIVSADKRGAHIVWQDATSPVQIFYTWDDIMSWAGATDARSSEHTSSTDDFHTYNAR